METKVKKSKKWKYHKSFCFVVPTKDHGVIKYSFQTQLYTCGVYGIWNNDSSEQGNYTPNQLVSMEKKFKKDFEDGKINDLVFGCEITVTDETGFYEEVN